MADNSLDDFFAKKDKSKKKKSKSTPSDRPNVSATPAQTQEKKKKEKTSKHSEKSDSQQNPTSEPKQEDAEWVDYEPEKEADYSGLRIQTLVVKEETEEESRESDGEEGNEDGEGRERDSSGPWRKQQGTPAPVKAPEPEPVKEEPVSTPAAEPASKPVGKYIPPSMRNAQASGSAGGGGSSMPSHLTRGRKKAAPNLKSEEDFPTLGATEPGIHSDGGAFEKVRSGGRQADDGSGKGLKLQLGNKFDALQSGAD